ncbi:MAG TPA: IS21-like element helper ATPase IstB [Acidimicrobiales bacterium]|nr:IS21-like element helper ATPase IstB [Acidimicrobiales bacterium]
MTKTHHLETTLRALRLGGMLDTIDARLAQAAAGELGHIEFLQVLCEDELSRRDAAGFTRRVREAHFESTTTIEEFDFAYNPKVPAAQIRDLATLRFIEASESVILHGPVGVGKTMIAQALGHAACRRGYSCAFTKTSRLVADLAGGHADRSWETRLRAWTRPGVLILDDFAMREFTPTQADDLYELVTERTKKSLIITANRAAADWYSLFPNPVVAESILDRIVNVAHHVHMDGKSYRPNKRPGAPKAGAKS